MRPLGDLWKYLETFFVVTMGEKVLLASSGILWKSGMLPTIPYYTGHLPTTQNDAAQSVHCDKVEKQRFRPIEKISLRSQAKMGRRIAQQLHRLK